MSDDFYAELAADYDRMIRWTKRLETERPWFEALWDRYGVKSVLDASCGTGRHLALFRSMGLRVAGADQSAGTIRLARERLGSDALLTSSRWEELPEKLEGAFDAVLCVGNSLPYVTDREELRRSIEGLWAKVSENGVLLLQWKNFEKLRASGERFLPLSSADEPHETVALRFYDYRPGRIDFNVVLLDRIEGAWAMRHEATALAPYQADDILGLLEKVGAKAEVYGSLGLAPFDIAESPDVVVIARSFVMGPQGNAVS